MNQSNAFTLLAHSSPPPPDSPPPPRRSARSASKAKITSEPNKSNMDGAPNGSAATGNSASGRDKKGVKKRKPAGSSATTSVDLDYVVDEVIVSPAVLAQQNGHIGGAMPTRSRHRKSKSKASKDLAVDTLAANTRANGKRSTNGSANGSASKHGTTIKERVIDWEIPRKVLHSSIGFLTLGLWATQGSARPVIIALCSGLVVVFPADFLRLKWPGPNSSFAKLYERMLGFLMRESEKTTWNGVIWYLIGVSFALAVYPLDIAVVSILILSWADTAASTLGRAYGPSTPPLPPQTPILGLPLAKRKSTAGFAAAAVTGTLIAIGFYRYIGTIRPQDLSWTFEHGVRSLRPEGPVSKAVREVLGKCGWHGVPTGGWVGLGIIGVVAGLVAGVAEALDLGGLDDNLTLPIISGGCIWGFFKLLSLFSS